MKRHTRFLITLVSAAIAISFATWLAVQVALQGIPHPMVLAGTVLSAAVALGWPLATMDGTLVRPTCTGCGGPAFGIQRFGFCMRCGTTSVRPMQAAACLDGSDA